MATPQREYTMADLTPKQQAYVRERVRNPTESESRSMLGGGYKSITSPSNRKSIKSIKVQQVLAKELAKAVEVHKDLEEYRRDPVRHLERRFQEHAHDPSITPNQTHALELLGKMKGAFIEKSVLVVGITPEVKLAESLFAPAVIVHEIAQPSEE